MKKKLITDEILLSEFGRAARNKYMREYRQKKAERIRKNQIDYWNRQGDLLFKNKLGGSENEKKM